MNNDERTTMPTESVGESNKCSANKCSSDRTTSETEHTFCTTSERPEKFLDRIRDTLYEILEEAYCGYVDSENTPGHEISERSDSPVQIIRLARTASFIHEKVNSILSRLDCMDDEYDADISEIKSKYNKIFTAINNIVTSVNTLDSKINCILSLAQSNNSMCYSIREHTKHAKESLAILTENTTINMQAYGTLVTKLESLPDCTNCWANMGEHKKSKHAESERSESNTYKSIWKSKWSLTDYKKLFEDSRIANFWFYLRNYLYAPVQDILTDCAEYLFRWMHEEISEYCSEPTDDISEVQDITIYLDRMAAFYDLVKAHKDDMPDDRYDAYMHILSDIDILLSERSDSEVSKLGGDENGNTSGETS